MRTYTKCGTPGYSAPEILMQVGEEVDEISRKLHMQSSQGYSFPCDVWSWGVLLCELTGGYNPFAHETKNLGEVFDNILNLNVNWPRNITAPALDLLKKVFDRDPVLRISI